MANKWYPYKNAGRLVLSKQQQVVDPDYVENLAWLMRYHPEQITPRHLLSAAQALEEHLHMVLHQNQTQRNNLCGSIQRAYHYLGRQQAEGEGDG